MELENISSLHDNISNLSQAEENYRVLFHNNPVPAVIFACDNFAIQQANRAALRLYGYPEEEFLGLRMDQLYFQHPQLDLEHELESLCSGKQKESSAPHVRKDGKVIWVEGAWQRLFYEEKLSVLAWLRRVQPPREEAAVVSKLAQFPPRPGSSEQKSSRLFSPGENAPESGIYAAIHDCRAGRTQEIVFMRGSRFEPCSACRQLRYRLIQTVPHISEDPDFDPERG